MFRFLTFMTLLFCSFQTVSGHGGQITVPVDFVTPNRGPGPGPPGVVGPGPARAPGPTGPGSRSVARASGIGMPRSAMATSRSGSSVQTGRKRTRGSGMERWEFWWECNKDAFLNLRDRLQNGENISGSSGFLVGLGKKDDAIASRRPGRQIIKETMLPPLIEMVEIDHPDIIDSTALALARITREQDSPEILEIIRKLLSNEHPSAIQSSALSLGVLGSPLAASDLYELMINSEKGRNLVKRHEVPYMVRSFAALSLGMIDAPDGVEKLVTVVKRAPEKDRDLKACGIIALGLMNHNQAADQAVTFLLQLLENDRLDPQVLAQVPVALGRLGDRVALPSLMKAFTRDRAHDLLTQSCAIGLGMLAGLENTEALGLLKAYIKQGKDEQTRHFSFIALAQIGARHDRFEQSVDLHHELSNFFQREITKPCQHTHRPWAALAAAIHAREHMPLQADLIRRIAWYFEDQNDPSCKGAMAVALGLLHARSEAPLLLEALHRQHDTSLKGYLCVALGLMNYREAAESIRDIAATEISSWGLRLQSVVGLGLMGDASAVDLLVKVLEEGQTLSVTSSAARALGVIGDISAVAPLMDLMEDESANKLARAFAVVALGILGEKTDLPWYCEMRKNYNYRATIPAMEEILTLL